MHTSLLKSALLCKDIKGILQFFTKHTMFISRRICEDLTGKPCFHFKPHCHHVNWGSSEHTVVTLTMCCSQGKNTLGRGSGRTASK